MDTFTFTKRDFVCLLAACTLLPLASFIAGFFIAGTAEPAELTPHHLEVSAPVADSCSLQPQENPDRNIDQLVILDRTELEQRPHEIAESAAELKPRALPLANVQYLVQAGLFSKAKNAGKFVDALAQRGINAEIMTSESEGVPYFRVVIGVFNSQNEAEAQLSRLESRHSIELYVTRQSAQPAYLAAL